MNIHENLFSNADINSLFINKPIYILHNPSNNTLVSYGNLLKIEERTIDHCSSTKKGSSGGPILSLVNNKVIGIHKGYGKREGDFNKGILISFGINEFIKYLDSRKSIQFVNDLDTKINKEINYSHISKNPISEGESIKNDYELNSTITIQNSHIYDLINKFKIKEGEEFILNNFDELPKKSRKSFGNINNINNKKRRTNSYGKIQFRNNKNIKINNTDDYNLLNQNFNNNYLINNDQNFTDNYFNFGINNNYQQNPNYYNNDFINKDINYGDEQLFRDENGRIIFRNGLMRGIIKKYAEIGNIVDTIQMIFKKGVKFYIKYKATESGDKASTFHNMCDLLNTSLVIIETNKGVRFGGFTTKSWSGNCLKKIDNNAFVFSIDNNKIYNVYNNAPAIGCYPKFGPVFFGCQIRIYDDFFRKNHTTCLKGLNYSTTKDFELNNGERFFIVKDIEVYSIET